MPNICSQQYRHTSVSLRHKSARRLKAALKLVRSRGIEWSESELLHRLAKLYLQAWRGRGTLTVNARRYNHELRNHRYCRMAWYIDKMLYRILWQRAIHSGESISRMLDFAIQHYMPRLLEAVLTNPYSRNRSAQRNFAYWQARQERRSNKRPGVFINYQCVTRENSELVLEYTQRYVIFTNSTPPPELLAPATAF
jgi:hypothetical protein